MTYRGVIRIVLDTRQTLRVCFKFLQFNLCVVIATTYRVVPVSYLVHGYSDRVIEEEMKFPFFFRLSLCRIHTLPIIHTAIICRQQYIIPLLICSAR